ncbi:MAG: hypothetical protein V8S34_02735 [Lawsonibacter sp.]
MNIRGYKPSVKGNDLQIKRVVEAMPEPSSPSSAPAAACGWPTPGRSCWSWRSAVPSPWSRP